MNLISCWPSLPKKYKTVWGVTHKRIETYKWPKPFGSFNSVLHHSSHRFILFWERGSKINKFNFQLEWLSKCELGSKWQVHPRRSIFILFILSQHFLYFFILFYTFLYFPISFLKFQFFLGHSSHRFILFGQRWPKSN